MALVAYENSDSSEFEDDDVIRSTEAVPEPEASENYNVGKSKESSPCLFNLLPLPSKKKPAVMEEDDEFLHKKEKDIVKPKAKITVPSLSDFRDVESSIPHKMKITSGKKSGLLSMLPQPKNAVTTTTKTMIPNVLAKKPSTSSVKKKEVSAVNKPKVDSKSLVQSYSDESDNDEVGNDFFSFNKPVEKITDLPVDTSEMVETVKNHAQSNPKPFNIESYFKSEDRNIHQVEGNYDEMETGSVAYSETGNTQHSCEPSSNDNGAILDDEAIMKLVGARGKRKREDIQIVDINQKEVLGDSREWLIKGLMDDTTKRVSASKKKGNEPTNMQKRKHQITYLAHQAKANEAELQNQWANNRMSKRQTQSKYGF